MHPNQKNQGTARATGARRAGGRSNSVTWSTKSETVSGMDDAVARTTTGAQRTRAAADGGTTGRGGGATTAQPASSTACAMVRAWRPHGPT